MDITSFLSNVGISAVSGSAVVLVLIHSLKDRWIEKAKAQYAEELEKLKDSLLGNQKNLQDRIDRAIFVSRAQFDTEFNAMKDIFKYATETRLAMEQIRPTFGLAPQVQDKNSRFEELFQREKAMSEVFNIFSSQLESLSPFYPSDLYASLSECRDIASLEITQVRVGGDLTFSSSWFLEGRKNTQDFCAAYQRASGIIRDRLERLSITVA